MSTTTTSVGDTIRRFLGGLFKARGTDDVEIDTEKSDGLITSKKPHIGTHGFEADDERTDDHRRYAYPDDDPIGITYILDPSKGGWVLFAQYTGSVPTARFEHDIAGTLDAGYCYLACTNANTVRLRISLPQAEVSSAVNSAATPASWVVELKSLTVTMRDAVFPSAATSPTITVVRQHRVTGVRDILLTCTSSVLTDSTVSGASGIEYLDWINYLYYVEWEPNHATGGYADYALGKVAVYVTKRAVE